MINVALLTDKNDHSSDTVQDTQKQDSEFEWIYLLWVFLGIIGLCIICGGMSYLFSMWNRYKAQQDHLIDEKNMIH
jgi:hypothetical protein